MSATASVADRIIVISPRTEATAHDGGARQSQFGGKRTERGNKCLTPLVVRALRALFTMRLVSTARWPLLQRSNRTPHASRLRIGRHFCRLLVY
jgi:hypothetical protein